MTTAVLLPAYNEASALPSLLPALLAPGRADLAIVVDDGSTDATPDAAARAAAAGLAVHVIRHPRNLGLGAALRTGIAHALGALADPDVLVTMDADGTHPAALVPRLASLAASGAADVAIAYRCLPGASETGVPPLRRLLSRAARLLLRAAWPVSGVTDYSSGFRAYSVRALRRAASLSPLPLPASPGFEAQIELLLRLAASGARFAETPLPLRYDLKRSRSSMRPLRTAVGYGRALLLSRAAMAPERAPRRLPAGR
jgi:dolichol-phosphate mannosyltransferase